MSNKSLILGETFEPKIIVINFSIKKIFLLFPLLYSKDSNNKIDRTSHRVHNIKVSLDALCALYNLYHGNGGTAL